MNVVSKKIVTAKKAARAPSPRTEPAAVDVASLYKTVATRFPKTMKRLAE
ncbi:hypothetical protein [Maricaulis sp.]